MGRIVIDPSSLVSGAGRAGSIGRELSASASRVRGLPKPEGTPPGVAGLLSSAASSLDRAGGSMAAQKQFLLFRAELARHADSPLAMLLNLLCPPLQTPFDLPVYKPTALEPVEEKGLNLRDILRAAASNADPAKPFDRLTDLIRGKGKNPPGPDEIWKLLDTSREFRRGAAEAGADLVTGLGKTAAVGAQYQIPGLGLAMEKLGLPPAKWRKEMEDLASWAAKDPGAFAEAFGKDAIAYDSHAKGDHAYAAGRNAFDLLSLLIPFAKAGKAGQLSRLAKEAERSAAGAERSLGDARLSAQNSRNSRSGHVDRMEQKPGESNKAWEARLEKKQQELARAEGKWQDARADHRSSQEQLAKAREEVTQAKERLKELLKESAEETAKSVNTVGQSVAETRQAELEEERRARGR